VAGSIKRELQVRFSTTGDGEVVRSIAKVDDGLKGVGDTSGAAGRSIGDLSESLDKGLENSVGRAFKATDRLNSIVGQIGGAFGLATLAVTGAVAIYNKLTTSSRAVGAGHGWMTEQVDAARAAFERGATAADKMLAAEERLAAAAGVRRALLDPDTRARVRAADAEIERSAKSIELINQQVPALEAQAAAIDKANIARAKELSQYALSRPGAKVRIAQMRDEIAAEAVRAQSLRTTAAALVDARGAYQATIRTNDAVIKSTVNTIKAAEGLSAAVAGTGTAAGPSLKSAMSEMTGPVTALLGAVDRLAEGFRALGRAAGAELRAAYEQSLPGLAASLGRVTVSSNELADSIGAGSSTNEELFKLPAAVKQTNAEMDAAKASIDSFGNAAGHALGNAAAAALVYGDSFAEVAAQAAAGLAAQAVSEAAFQAAKALAFLASGLFTGNPGYFAAASQAAASAAAFGAIAAVAVPVARATGSAGGAGGGSSGIPAGPSARDAGRTGDTGGGAETIIINMGNQRLFATERDVGSALTRSLNAASRGRGRPRIRGAAIGGA
jgi:hypothetical protein